MSPSLRPAAPVADRGWRAAAAYTAGGVGGGIVGAAVVAAITSLIKTILAVTSGQGVWLLLALPVVGVGLSTLVLHVVGGGEPAQRLGSTQGPTSSPVRPRRTWVRYLPRIPTAWRRFPSDVARADLTGDVVATAGGEERFPWRCAPLRAVAIVVTVGLGAPMGTEAPAAHLGVAIGSALSRLRRSSPGERSQWGRWLQRGAGMAGGAAGVAVLMGIPLVGTAFILELGRRRRIPLTTPRIAAALVGGVIGWAVNQVLRLDLIRLVIPKVPPTGIRQAVETALYAGLSGGIVTAIAGWAIYQARGWTAGPTRRLLLGAIAMTAVAASVMVVADARAAIGPGGGAILWAESPVGSAGPAWLLLLVAALRALATTTAVAAGGCGGVFVPFLAIGDLAARSFAPHLGISGDLAGASGAAAGIAGGYRLPWTAMFMVIGIGGPTAARFTSLGAVLIAAIAGAVVSLGLDRVRRIRDPPVAAGSTASQMSAADERSSEQTGLSLERPERRGQFQRANLRGPVWFLRPKSDPHEGGHGQQ